MIQGSLIPMVKNYLLRNELSLRTLQFQDFNFHTDLQQGIDALNYSQPTPIQELAIPIILQEKDLLAVAQTGTGKTAAFVLPILHKLSATNNHTTNTIVLVPTRELALQIDQAIEGLSYFTQVSSLAIYGGNDGSAFLNEKNALTTGANIIIATPGRLKAHLNMGYVKFDQIQHFILDEADKMLNMGFIDDIHFIHKFLPERKQTLLFSATMPDGIKKLAHQLLKEPEQIAIAISKPAEGVKQKAYSVYEGQKLPILKAILIGRSTEVIILFTSTKKAASQVHLELKGTGIQCETIHSDLTQSEREEVMSKFRARKINVLVATDILSRGIDVDNINLVINYDLPSDAEDYVHRIGRTARANTKGEAITLITPADQYKFHLIEQLIEKEVPKGNVPAYLGEAPAYDPEKSTKKNKKRRRKW
jgi:superfamily II DNA/RNA helicase